MAHRCTGRAGRPTIAVAIVLVAAPASSGEEPTARVDQAALVERLARGSETVTDRRAVASLRANAGPSFARPAPRDGLGAQLDEALRLVARALSGPVHEPGEALEGLRAVDRRIEAELARIRDRILKLGGSPRLLERWTTARDRYRTLLDPLIAADPGRAASDAVRLREVVSGILHELAAGTATSPPPALGTLPYRRPSLAPRAPPSGPPITPSYADPGPGAATSEDLEETPEAPLSAAILAKAEELGWDAVRIFEFVRNEIATEWYAGSLKGAEETLRQRAGNDVDQASLLLALGRASQLAGRYVRGVVELPVESVAASLGLADPGDVPRALARAGVAYEPVLAGGRIAAVEVEQTWVTVFAPYANYRGAVVDLTGPSWIPLAPALATVDWTPASGVLDEMGLDLGAFVEDHLATDRSELPMERLRAAVEGHLATSGAETMYEEQLAGRATLEERAQLLPSSLPAKVVRVVHEAPSLDEPQRHSVRFVARSGLSSGSTVVFDETLTLAELAGRRVTLSYTPATVDDHEIVNAYGGLASVPCYLVELRLQLKVDGRLRRAGLEALDMGVPHRLEITLAGPAGAEVMVRQLTSGSYYALELGAGEPTVWGDDGPDPGDTEGLAARLLARIGRDFDARWSAAERELADLMGIGLVRPQPTLAIVDDVVAIETLAGMPLRLEWKGVTLDALARAAEPVASSAEEERRWLELAALEGSGLEHAVFEDAFLVDAISADRALGMARDAGAAVLRLDAASLPSALPDLPHPAAVKSELEQAVALGYEVEIADVVTVRHAWQGSAWRIIDPQGRGAGYLLAGGLAGGATTEPPGSWALSFLEAALAQPYAEGVNLDPLAGVSAARLEGTDEQRGAVDSILASPLGVVVRDELGRPVVGAEVTFVAVDGGGVLLDDQGDGHPTLLARTDLLGRALAPFRLGRETWRNPILEREDPADGEPSQALLHRVDAHVRSHQGPIPVDAPFSAVAFPGEPVVLRRTDAADPFIEGLPGQWSDTFPVVAEDSFGNPVANVGLRFEAGPPEIDETCSNGGLPERASVFDPDDPSCPPVPYLGDCGGSTLTLTSRAAAVQVGVILGDSVSAAYPVSASAPELAEVPVLTSTYFVTYQRNPVTGECSPLATAEMHSPVLNDELGHNVQAAPVANPYAEPLLIEVRAWQSDYAWWCNPSVSPCVWEWRETDSGSWVPASANLELTVDQLGSATPADAVGPGLYETVLTTGPEPAFHALTARATEVRATVGLPCPLCDSGTGCPGELPWWCPASGAPPHPFEETYIDFERTLNGVWGLRTEVTAVSPEPVVVDIDGATTAFHDLLYGIEPDEYVSLATQLDLLDNGVWRATYEGGSGPSTGRATLPRATVLDPEAVHEVELVLNRGSAAEVRSEPWELPLDDPLLTPPPDPFQVAVDVDLAGQAFCSEVQSFTFALSREAEVDLVFRRLESVDGSGDPVTGDELVMLEDEILGPGEHGYRLSPADLGNVDFVLPPGDWLYDLTATAGDSGQTRLHRGRVRTQLRPSDLLPVSHVLVEGVDVWGGTLSLQRQDWEIPARGASLDLVRTYSSSWDAEPGPLGLGWAHNWDSHVIVTPCGEVIVVGGEGSGMRFVDDGLGGLVATSGYHGTLIADPGSLTFDFYAKGGRRYHYQPTGSSRWTLAWVEDPDGNRVDLFYDGSASRPLLVAVRDGAGRTLTFTYEQRTFLLATGVELWTGQVLTRVGGPDGLSVSFEYDGRGHLVRARREGDAGVERYDYELVSEPLVPLRTALAAVTDELDGGATTYEYVAGRIGIQGVLEVPHLLVERVTRPMGGETSFAYDLPGLLARSAPELVHGVTDPRGEQTTYALDTYGAPLWIVDPLGHETRMTWTADDRLMTSRTDASGRTTSYAYDEHGNRLSEEVAVVDVDGVAHLYRRETAYVPPESFDPPYVKDRPVSRTDRDGHTTTFAYDLEGHLLETTVQVDGSPVTTRHTVLGNGDRASTTDPEGRTTFFSYDARGHLARVTDPLGGETSTLWSDRGLALTRVDALGRETTFEHDGLGRPTAVHRPLGATETTTYDDGANRTIRVDAEGRVRVEERDLEDRVVRDVDPEGAERLFGYDLAGNKTLETLWFDQATPRHDVTFGYDAAGRLERRVEPLGRETAYEHDAVGNVIRETLSDSTDPGFEARVTVSDYDALDRRIRLTRFLGAQPVTIETLYDGESDVLRETDPLGRVTAHAYDALHRRTETAEPEGKLTRFAYDRAGNLVSEVRANDPEDRVRTFVYDGLDRVVRRRDATGGEHHLDYDAVGNLVREIDPLLNVTSHELDALDRKTRTIRHLNRVTQPARTVVTEWEHDLVGNLLLERWGNGNEVVHAYDGLDRLLSTTDALGPVASATYDARGNRVTATDANGNVRTNGWDALDRLVLELLPEDRTLTHAYDVAGNRVATTDARGHATRFAFDTLDRMVAETAPEPFAYTRVMDYDLVGNKVSETDRRGLTTTSAYDELDRLVTVTDPPPFSTIVTSTWDRVGNRLSETDRRGITTQFEYDGENRLVRTERAGIQLSQTVWDAAGNRRFEHDANSHVTGFEYDERNLLTAVNRPEASITRYALDDMGDRVEETDPEGRVTTRSYDARRRLVEETDPALETTSFEHDGNGNVVARVRPLLGRWEMGFDGADRLVTVRDPLGNETTYGYDENGNRTSVEDAEGNLTTHAWDELDQRVRMDYADGAFETYGHDPEGDLVSRTDPLGRTVTTTWDELGRKSSEVYPPPSPPTGADLLSIVWTHDENGNPTQVEEGYSGPSGTRATVRVWDDLDRLSSVTDPEGRTLSYLYDANGNRTRLTDPDGKVTLYAFDGLNRPTSVAIGGGGVTAYSYFKDSRLQRVDFPNGTRATYAYDIAGRVASIVNTFGAATISRYDYLYDANGNRVEQIEENGGAPETTAYGYDDADRLTEVTYPDRTVAYGYDGVGNRVSEDAADPGGAPLVDRTLAYNERNQLTSITDHLDPQASVTYTWDANGNQTAKTVDTTTAAFTFDLRDRLVQVTQGAALLGRYAYDHQDLRTYKETPTEALRTLYDDQSVLLQTDAATGATLAKYDYGPDRLLSLDGATHGRQYYLHDALGSIVDLTRPDGTLAARYQWDAWGNPRASSGASENPFGFTGHERDEGTGLYYAKARFYDAEVGRFLSEDPLEGEAETPLSLQKYLYGYSNPTVYVDPRGEATVTIFGFEFDAPDIVYEAATFQLGLGLGLATEGVKRVGAFLEASQSPLSVLEPLRTGLDTSIDANARLVVAYQAEGLAGVREEQGDLRQEYQGHLRGAIEGLPIARTGLAAKAFIEAEAFLTAGRELGHTTLLAMEDAALFAGGRLALREAPGVPSTGTPRINLAGKRSLRVEATILGEGATGGVATSTAYVTRSAAADASQAETTALQSFYPPNRGFLGDTGRKFAQRGELIDRYGGSDASRYFSPAGTPRAARALPPGTADQPLRTFEVMKPFELDAGVVAPAFGQLGLGVQYRTPVALRVLLRRGILREVTP